MDRCSNRCGKSQREKESEKRVSSKKMRVPEKVEKSRNTVFFQSEGRKVGWLKRRARSHLVGWEIKNCTRLWREARFAPNSLATLRGSYVGVKARCPIELVSVAFGIFPVNFHTKWRLWHVHVHVDCAGSHKTAVAAVFVRHFPRTFPHSRVLVTCPCAFRLPRDLF